jgi:hypothetical protein
MLGMEMDEKPFFDPNTGKKERSSRNVFIIL